MSNKVYFDEDKIEELKNTTIDILRGYDVVNNHATEILFQTQLGIYYKTGEMTMNDILEKTSRLCKTLFMTNEKSEELRKDLNDIIREKYFPKKD